MLRGLGECCIRNAEHNGHKVTRKNKSIEAISRTNLMLGGVPRVAMGKYVPLLVDAGLSVVMLMQLTTGPNPARKVS